MQVCQGTFCSDFPAFHADPGGGARYQFLSTGTLEPLLGGSGLFLGLGFLLAAQVGGGDMPIVTESVIALAATTQVAQVGKPGTPGCTILNPVSKMCLSFYFLHAATHSL